MYIYLYILCYSLNHELWYCQVFDMDNLVMTVDNLAHHICPTVHEKASRWESVLLHVLCYRLSCV